MTADPFGLDRFVRTQDPVYGRVTAELRDGRKRTHWMWFIFPQIRGLGHSPMAVRYALSGRDEARAYYDHPVLGARLRECTGLVNAVRGATAHRIFGSPDDLKFRSSMSLFTVVAPEEPVFRDALLAWFGGVPDPATVERL